VSNSITSARRSPSLDEAKFLNLLLKFPNGASHKLRRSRGTALRQQDKLRHVHRKPDGVSSVVSVRRSEREQAQEPTSARRQQLPASLLVSPQGSQLALSRVLLRAPSQIPCDAP
jgi:hypothetical protein